MHILDMLQAIVHSLTQIATAVIITILQRWLLELSSIEKDMRWLRRQALFQIVARAKWYRGKELYHQWRGTRILGYAERTA